MRIELELPDWVNAENLYLITRNELIAKKMSGQSWEIKTTRCNKCGHCCEIHPKVGAYFPLKENGECIHLRREGRKKMCYLGMEKPLACVLGEPEGMEHKKIKCKIKYKVVKN